MGFVFIHSATLCLLIGDFCLFLFEVNIDRFVLTAILFFIFWLFCSFSVSLFFSCFLLCDLMTFFSVIFRFLSLYLLWIYYRSFPLWLPWGLHIASDICNSLFYVDNNKFKHILKLYIFIPSALFYIFYITFL